MLIKKITPLALLLLLGFIWGTGYSIARFATTHEVPPLGYSFWQSLGPAILISLLTLFKKTTLQTLCRKESFQAKTAIPYLRYFLICGLTGIVIPNTNMYFCSPHLPAGLLAVIVNTVPIIAYSMALIARVESFNIVRFIGIGCALSGLMLIVYPTMSLPASDMTPWVISALITPLSFAFCAVYISRYRPTNNDSLLLAAGTLIASSLILLPSILLSGNFYMFHFPLTLPDQVILLEIVLSSIGYVLFFQLIKIAGPVYYGLVDTIVALTGLFWGFVIFQEQLNRWTGVAVLLILLALYLVSKKQPMHLIPSRDREGASGLAKLH